MSLVRGNIRIGLISKSKDNFPNAVDDILEDSDINISTHEIEDCSADKFSNQSALILYINNTIADQFDPKEYKQSVILMSDSKDVLEEGINMDFADYIHTSDTTFKKEVLLNRVENLSVPDQKSFYESNEIEDEDLSSLVENSPDLTVVFNDDMSIKYLNKEIQEIGRVPSRSSSASDIVENIHSEDKQKVVDDFKYVVNNTNETRRTEFRAFINGEWSWYESIAQNLLDQKGIEGIYCVVRDIEDRKDKERKLKRERDRLDNVVSIMSHDLRNLLNVALARSEMINEQYDGDQNAQAISRSLERMEDLIGDSLKLAETGELVSEKQTLEIQGLVDQCYRNAIPDKDRDRSDIFCNSDAVIKGDKSRVANLFENLFKNSVDHNSGDVRIEVGLLESGNGFFVEDDGSGIPEDMRDKVFDTGYSDREGGTGLGLSIVSEIAKSHGWRSELKTGELGGARFEFTNVEIVRLD